MAGIVQQLRDQAKRTSEATRFMAEHRNAEYRRRGEADPQYGWAKPEETLEWRAADLLQDRCTKIADVLRDHWLVSVNCDHEAKTDRAQCSCSLVVFPTRQSVGEAVSDWINHVLEQI